MPCKRCSIPSEGGLALPPLTSGLGVSLPTFTPEPRLSQQTGPVHFPFSTRRSILGENDSERPAPLTPCQARRNACGAQRVKTDRGPRLTTCTSVCPPIHFHQPVGTLCIWFPARGFPDTGKEPPYRCKRHKRDTVSIPGSGRSPLEEEMAAHSSILAGKCHGQRSLVGYHPWGREESDTAGVLLPHQGSSPLGLLQWEPRVLTPGPAGKSLASYPL